MFGWNKDMRLVNEKDNTDFPFYRNIFDILYRTKTLTGELRDCLLYTS